MLGNWGSLCETNPVIGTNTFDTKPRDRGLSDAELAAIWKAAPDNDYRRIVKLLMLTGQRRDEIACPALARNRPGHQANHAVVGPDKEWTGTSDSAGERSDGHPAKLQPSP